MTIDFSDYEYFLFAIVIVSARNKELMVDGHMS